MLEFVVDASVVEVTLKPLAIVVKENMGVFSYRRKECGHIFIFQLHFVKQYIVEACLLTQNLIYCLA